MSQACQYWSTLVSEVNDSTVVTMAAKNQSSGIIRVFIWIYGRRLKSFLNFRSNSNIKEYVYAFLQWSPACRISVDWIILSMKSNNDRLLLMCWKMKFRILHFTHNLLRIRLHLTTPTIHDTLFSIKRNFSWCSALQWHPGVL